MKTHIRGSFVALPTPFCAEHPERIDFQALGRLIELQVKGGTDGLVVAGTTGEAATLRDAEREAVVAFCVGQAGGRLPVLAGVGTNDTRTTLRHARAARDAGASGLLVVTPYYNRPEASGLRRHYGTLADAVDLPLVLYNVPARTGVDLQPETVAQLFEQHENVCAIKQASSDAGRIEALLECGIDVLCGEDLQVPDAMLSGAVGAIGVVGNLFPAEMAQLVHESAPGGDHTLAAARFEELSPVMRALFLESNPVPLKAALALFGLASGDVRSPLAPLAPENLSRLQEALGLDQLELP